MFNKSTITILLVTLIVTACQPAPTATEAAPSPTLEPVPTVPVPDVTLEPTAEPVRISYTAYHGGPQHGSWERDNVSDFMEAHPAISILHTNITIYASPVPRNIDDQLLSDTPPDVISAPMAGLFLDYVEQGLIADITDLWEANGWYDKFPQSVIAMATVDGRQYFVPTMLQFHPIWYNTDVFVAHDINPPQTWNELLTICDKLSNAGQTPITISVSGWNAPTARWFTYLNLRVNGPDFHASLMRGEVSWLDERVIKVFDYWQEMFDHNCFSENVAQTNYAAAAQGVADGEAAMYLLGEWLSESYPNGIPDNLDHFPVPIIDSMIPNGEIAHQYGAFLPTTAEHPEEAREFLTWLGSVEVHNSFGESLHRISTHADLSPALFDEKYQRGADMTANAGYLTALFELSTHANVASSGLTAFTTFIKTPDNYESALVHLEAARESIYGPLP